MMKHLLRLLAILFLFFIGVSCSNDDDKSPEIVTLKANLSRISGNPTDASGSATITLNKTEKIININVSFTGINPTEVLIVNSDGTNVIVDLSENNKQISISPITKTLTISDSQIAELMTSTTNMVLYEPTSSAGYIQIGGQLKI